MSGHNYVVGAELLRHTWDGWAEDCQNQFSKMLREVWYPVIRDFYPSANGNWDASMQQVMIGMGVYLEDRAMYAVSTRSRRSIDLERETVRLSEKHPRYGYRRVTAMMNRAGHEVNEKRVQAVRRKHGLQVRRKQRKTRRVSQDQAVRLRASRDSSTDARFPTPAIFPKY